jgi:hypothetical protein
MIYSKNPTSLVFIPPGNKNGILCCWRTSHYWAGYVLYVSLNHNSYLLADGVILGKSDFSFAVDRALADSSLRVFKSSRQKVCHYVDLVITTPSGRFGSTGVHSLPWFLE